MKEFGEELIGEPLYASPENSDLKMLANSVNKITRRKVSLITKSGSSDSRHFVSTGSTCIDFGPSGENLHSDNEYALTDSYFEYADILCDFLKSLNGSVVKNSLII